MRAMRARRRVPPRSSPGTRSRSTLAPDRASPNSLFIKTGAVFRHCGDGVLSVCFAPLLNTYLLAAPGKPRIPGGFNPKGAIDEALRDRISGASGSERAGARDDRALQGHD